MLQSLAQILPHAAQKFGRKTALIVDGRELSFQELDALSNALAGSLVKLGIEPGDRVTYIRQILGNGSSLITVFLKLAQSSIP